jgi:hypothetical protein
MRAMTTRLLAGQARTLPLAALLVAGFSIPMAGEARAAQTPPSSPAQTAPPPAPAGGAQAAGAPNVPSELPTIRLEVRVFDGSDDVTADSRVKLYPKGQRTSDIPMTAAGAGQATTAMVPVGFYDAQAMRERHGAAPNIRWAQQWLVQRYPDEYGRHLEVINYKTGYGALQIRPAPSDASAAKGWTGVVYPAGDAAKELGKSVASGDDLLFALPSGRYDIKVTLADKSTQWVRDIDVPADRTRLKTWSAASSSR